MEERISFSYYYGGESEQFSFYRIPRQLVVGEYFKRLSTDAKLLYGLMLDRMGLSARNGWYDDDRRVFIYYPLDEIQAALNCGHDKALKLLCELDTKKGIGLIERIKQGQGRPTIIYVKQFVTADIPAVPPRLPESRNPDFGKAEVKTSEKPKSRLLESRSPDFGKTDTSYNNINHTYKSYTDPSIYPSADGRIDRGSCKERIRSNIEYGHMAATLPSYQMEDVDELVDIMVDTVCSTRPTVKIGGEDVPIEEVRKRFLSLDESHVEYVLDSMKKTTTKIYNIHAYLLAALYRAPTTISHYYTAEVMHDQYGGP